MEKYFFQAVSGDGKTIEGSLEAQSEGEAREKLGNARLAVLALEPFDQEKHHVQEGFLFGFNGKNKNGRTIKGTIIAFDKYQAFVQLRQEYGLEVDSLFRADYDELSKQQEKEQGLSDLLARYQLHESKNQEKRPLGQEEKNQRILEKALKSQEKEKTFLSKQISQFADELEQKLKDNELFINPEKRRAIETTINRLHTIKQSNNIAHLKKLLEQLFKGLDQEDLFLAAAEIDPDLKDEYEVARRNLEDSTIRFKSDIQSGIKQLQKTSDPQQSIFARWSFSGMWHHLSQQIYVTALIFTLFAFLAIILGVLGKWMNIEILHRLVTVLGSSLLFWYSLGVAVMFVLLWAIQFEIKKTESRFSPQHLKILIGVAAFIIFSLNAPTIFFWTI